VITDYRTAIHDSQQPPQLVRRPRVSFTLFFVALAGYVLVRPVSNNNILFPIFVLMAVMATLRLARGPGRPLNVGIRNCMTMYFFWSFSWSLMALVRGNQGRSNTLLTYILGPLLFVLIVKAASQDGIRQFTRILVWVNLYTGASIANKVLFERGKVPIMLPILNFLDEGFGINTNGEYQVRHYGISTLVALTPLLLASLMVNSSSADFGPKWARVISVSTSSLAALMVGRQALILVLIMCPLITLLLVHRLLPISERVRGDARIIPRSVLLPVLVSLAGYAMLRLLNISPNRLFNSFVENLEIRPVGSIGPVGERTQQARKLVEMWTKSPLYGHGFNATVPGYFRDVNRPWAFELQYHLLLFNTGVLGVAILGAALSQGTSVVLRVVRRGGADAIVMIPLIVAAASMLIANGTNPYLQAVGHMWAVFLPLAAANVFLAADKTVDGATAPAPSAY
jgi:hypothetical protein